MSPRELLRGLSGLPFAKYEGTGNDFVILEPLAWEAEGEAERARALCDRHLGVGADGLLLLLPPEGEGEARMRVLNADGSEAEMCGNGVRCLARYLHDRGRMGEELRVETGAGLIRPRLVRGEDGEPAFAVDMGVPVFQRSKIPMNGRESAQVSEEILEELELGGLPLRITALSMGNPHAVAFVKDLEAVDLAHIGPLVERHKRFPAGANAGFAQVLGKQHLRLRVWERGAGATLACGTGACAALVAAVLLEHCVEDATVSLPGGDLRIAWGADHHVVMTGPARPVFEGRLS